MDIFCHQSLEFHLQFKSMLAMAGMRQTTVIATIIFQGQPQNGA
ncbi:Uncharacterised protein [Serratia fonticola]|jgi:hypothetical protein|nr:Uncharacterised protein [Serratia fonticola]